MNSKFVPRRAAVHASVASVSLAVIASVVGCSSAATGSAPVEPGSQNSDGGTSAETNPADGTCTTSAECKAAGTTCASGVCQLEQCAGTYNSNPPLGAGGYAWLDRELMVATSGMSAVTVYDGSSTGAIGADTLVGDVSVPAAPVDLAGGNLNGSRPEAVATVDLTNALTITTPGVGSATIDLSFAGKLVATGDTDGDGIAEILVSDGGTQYAVCNAVKSTCTAGTATLPGAVVDVAIADVDGDGKGELLFAIGSSVYPISTTFPSVSWAMAKPVSYMTAGDLDGDGKAELVVKSQGAITAGFTDDQIDVYDFASGGSVSHLSTAQLKRGSLDMSVWTFDQTTVLAVMTDDSDVVPYSYASAMLTPGVSAALTDSGATRIGTGDVDGNSAMVSLMAGPKLITGKVIPLAVLTAPPYSATHSTGSATASIGSSTQMGTGTSMGMSTSMALNLSVGIYANFPLVGFGAYLGDSYSNTISHETSHSTSLSTTVSQSFNPDPTNDGYYSGHVVVAGGCYHQYDYVLDDPTSHFQTSANSQFSVFRPVGADQQTFTTRQYASIVQATGNALPTITIPYKIGDVSSYPTSPETLAGQPIPADDNVFPNPPSLSVGTSTSGSFSLGISTDTTNSTSTSSSYGPSVNLNANVGWVQVQVGVSETFTVDSGYSVTVGQTTTFGGDVSPIRQDQGQAEDDGALYGYTFTPYVYREHFTPTDIAAADGGASGTSPGYYVLTYAVTQRGSGQ